MQQWSLMLPSHPAPPLDSLGGAGLTDRLHRPISCRGSSPVTWGPTHIPHSARSSARGSSPVTWDPPHPTLSEGALGAPPPMMGPTPSRTQRALLGAPPVMWGPHHPHSDEALLGVVPLPLLPLSHLGCPSALISEAQTVSVLRKLVQAPASEDTSRRPRMQPSRLQLPATVPPSVRTLLPTAALSAQPHLMACR